MFSEREGSFLLRSLLRIKKKYSAYWVSMLGHRLLRSVVSKLDRALYRYMPSLGEYYACSCNY